MATSNIYGTTGMLFQMDANDFDPFQTYSLPNTWTTDATRASTASNPYSSLSYTSPGDFQSYNGWSNWNAADKTYRNQYADNGYSLDTAKSFYTQPSNGDWAAYQDALTQPGVTAANQAYDKAKKQLEEWSAGSGLYGSSIMANQATQSVLQPYMDALSVNAANAAAKRYETQDASSQFLANLANNIYGTRTSEWGKLDARNLQEALAQNSFNQTQDAQKLSQMNNLNSYNLSRSNAQNAFNMNQAQGNAQWNQWANTYDNNLLKEGWNNAADQAKFNALQNQQAFNNYNTIWQQINPGQEEYLQNQTASLAAGRENSSGSGLGSIIGGVGGILAAPFTGGTSLLGTISSGLGGLMSSGSGFSGPGYGYLGNAMLNAPMGGY